VLIPCNTKSVEYINCINSGRLLVCCWEECGINSRATISYPKSGFCNISATEKLSRVASLLWKLQDFSHISSACTIHTILNKLFFQALTHLQPLQSAANVWLPLWITTPSRVSLRRTLPDLPMSWSPHRVKPWRPVFHFHTSQTAPPAFQILVQPQRLWMEVRLRQKHILSICRNFVMSLMEFWCTAVAANQPAA